MMKLRSILIIVSLALAMVPFYYINRWLQEVIRPRDSAGRFFLFLFANFLGIVVYTVLVVGLAVRLFGR
ncbi:MAG: hypothetical protein JST68_26925 [Bacteroidetes bacterium]|nr:hypothetical protein [Bacteroidota bacterium]